MSALTLIEKAEDLGNYDSEGVLWIFRRPACKIDLSLRYNAKEDRFRAVVQDETHYVPFSGRTRREAVEGVLDAFLQRL